MPGHGVTTRDISTHALREEGDESAKQVARDG